MHCEINAQIFSYESLKGYTLYTWPFASCDRCCVTMLQSGITRFVFPSIPPHLVERWGEPLKKTVKYIAEAGAEAVEIPLETINAYPPPFVYEFETPDKPEHFCC